MKKLASLILLVLSSLIAFCQAPQGTNYQCVVRDNAGAIIPNRSVGFKFIVHQGSATGTATYSETSPATTNQFGLASLVIGNGTPVTGTFSAINWAAGPYFLETLVDIAGGVNYVSMGTQQLVSVPYALYADNANEHQTLSISGTQLSISSGNTVTLPNGSSGATAAPFQQTLQQGTGYSFVSATSEPGVDTFLAVFGYYPGNNVNSGVAPIVQRDAFTGSYELVGGGAYVGQCGGGNGVSITSATTHRGGIYFTYSNGCGTNVLQTPTGPVTFDVAPTGSNGLIFSNGTYLYVNSGTNYFKYTVSGNQCTFVSTFTFANMPSGVKAIMAYGSDIFVLTTTMLYLYDYNGTMAAYKPVYGSPTGMVNIDATRLYLVSSALSPTTTANTVSGGFVMTPIHKF